MSVLQQALYTIIVSYSCISTSLVVSWPSSIQKLFLSANTTLERPMTDAEIALVGSLPSFGALVGTPICGFLLDGIGRKYTCILFSLPQLIFWIIVSLSTRVEVILAARFFSGLGYCMLLIVSVFINEFCQKSIRGMMTCGGTLGYGLGMLMSYLIGGYLEYKTMNYIFLSLSVFGILILLPLKESPMFLMKEGREKDAKKSVGFYRGYKDNSREVMQEIITMRRALNPDIDDTTNEEMKHAREDEKISKWRQIRESTSTHRALFVLLTLYLAAAFQGMVAVQVYADRLFAEAVPNMSSTVSSALFASVAILSICLAAYLIDKAGRRLLMIVTSIGAGVCCVLLGSQIHLQWGPHWITIVFIYLFVVSFSCGSGTIPFVVVAEVFLPEVRGIMTMICVEWAWICNFLILFIFNYLVNWIGLGSVFYLFAIVGLSNAVFCFFFLPETKAVPVDVIQTLFVKKTSHNNSF